MSVFRFSPQASIAAAEGGEQAATELAALDFAESLLAFVEVLRGFSFNWNLTLISFGRQARCNCYPNKKPLTERLFYVHL